MSSIATIIVFNVLLLSKQFFLFLFWHCNPFSSFSSANSLINFTESYLFSHPERPANVHAARATKNSLGVVVTDAPPHTYQAGVHASRTKLVSSHGLATCCYRHQASSWPGAFLVTSVYKSRHPPAIMYPLCIPSNSLQLKCNPPPPTNSPLLKCTPYLTPRLHALSQKLS